MKVMLESSGFGAEPGALHKRDLVITFARGNYSTVSTVWFEINGSPPRGRAIMMLDQVGFGLGRDEPYEIDEFDPLATYLETEQRDMVKAPLKSIQGFYDLAHWAYQQIPEGESHITIRRKPEGGLELFKWVDGVITPINRPESD